LIFVVVMMTTSQAAPSKLFGLWYCGDDYCDWAAEPNLNNAQWIVNRGDGKPTANVVILAFVDPLALLQQTTNSITLNGIPRGMTKNVVNFFSSKGVSVQISIGGAAYTSNWDQALSINTKQLATNVANMAKNLGVGIEIDYENENSATLNNLDTFVKTYRSIIAYGESAGNLLTVDTGAGTGYLTSVSVKASGWLNSSQVNWENAMVTGSPYDDASTPEYYWTQHLTGASWASLPPVAPNQLTGGMYASSGAKECKQFDGTVLQQIIPWVEQQKMRGIFFWAAGCPGPNNCAYNCTGLQQGSIAYLG